MEVDDDDDDMNTSRSPTTDNALKAFFGKNKTTDPKANKSSSSSSRRITSKFLMEDDDDDDDMNTSRSPTTDIALKEFFGKDKTTDPKRKLPTAATNNTTTSSKKQKLNDGAARRSGVEEEEEDFDLLVKSDEEEPSSSEEDSWPVVVTPPVDGEEEGEDLEDESVEALLILCDGTRVENNKYLNDDYEKLLRYESEGKVTQALQCLENLVSASREKSPDNVHNIFELSVEEQSKTKQKYGSHYQLWTQYITTVHNTMFLMTGFTFALEFQTEQFLKAMIEIKAFPDAEEFKTIVLNIGYSFYYTFVRQCEQYLIGLKRESK
jgi:hypothetical protein